MAYTCHQVFGEYMQEMAAHRRGVVAAFCIDVLDEAAGSLRVPPELGAWNACLGAVDTTRIYIHLDVVARRVHGNLCQSSAGRRRKGKKGAGKGRDRFRRLHEAELRAALLGAYEAALRDLTSALAWATTCAARLDLRIRAPAMGDSIAR